MIKLVTWIDDGREEITTLTAMAEPAEEVAARPFSWELLHQRFVSRLEKEREG